MGARVRRSRLVQIKSNEPASAHDTATVLFGIGGVRVTEAEREADGRLTVWAEVTVPSACPRCGAFSDRVHEVVVTRPRDVRASGEPVDFFLVKRRLQCPDGGCPQGTFTEWVPQVPPRCTITRRLLDQAGTEIADRGITPAGAARHAGISLAVRAWRVRRESGRGPGGGARPGGSPGH